MNYKRLRGFTLLELAVVLTLIGIITGDALLVLTASVQSTQFNVTVARMDAIDKAILNFAKINNRIPCPGDLAQNSGATATTANNQYGVESANLGSCTGGTPHATSTTTAGTAEGSVPTRTLQLPDDYMYDGWGHRIRYAVDPVYTASYSSPTIAYPLPASVICNPSQSPNPTAITVLDAGGANRTNSAAYVLVSHGANGHGAYTNSYASSAGGLLNSGSTNYNEVHYNCHCSLAGSVVVPTSYYATYVAQAPTQTTSGTSTTNFDDIVTFKDPWQIQDKNFPPVGNCAASFGVFDNATGRSQSFNSSGTYVSSFTPSGFTGFGTMDSQLNVWWGTTSNTVIEYASPGYTGGATISTGKSTSSSSATALSNVKSVITDSYGGIWVADSGNNRILGYNSSNSYNPNLGAVSQSSTFNVPTFLAFDAAGFLWVADTGDNLIQKMVPEGWANGTTNTGPANIVATITAAATVTGIAADSYNNLWVATSAPSLKKYNSFGTLISSCPNITFGTGTGNGNFNGIKQIATDSGNNLWVVDNANNRVQVLNSVCNFLFGIGAGYNGVTGTIGSAGTGHGQFTGPTSINLLSSTSR